MQRDWQKQSNTADQEFKPNRFAQIVVVAVICLFLASFFVEERQPVQQSASGNSEATETLLPAGIIGCVSEDYYDQYITALVQKDARAFNYLRPAFCHNLSNLPFSVLDQGWLQSEIRVYHKDGRVRQYIVSAEELRN